MTDRSAIEWTQATWNPVTGCDRISPGCQLAGGGQFLLALRQGVLHLSDHLGVQHNAAFPSEWPRRLILGWCPQLGLTDHEALLS